MILPKYPSSFFLANSASIKSSSVKSARARFLRFSSAAGPYKCEVWWLVFSMRVSRSCYTMQRFVKPVSRCIVRQVSQTVASCNRSLTPVNDVWKRQFCRANLPSTQ
jgi:hypothetical protein